MAIIERGRIRGRHIELPSAVALPDGTEVIVSIEPLPPSLDASGTPAAMNEELTEFFGM